MCTLKSASTHLHTHTCTLKSAYTLTHSAHLQMHTHLNTHVHTYKSIQTHPHTHMHTYKCIHTCMHMCTLKNYTHTPTHTCVHLPMHAYPAYTCAHTHTCPLPQKDPRWYIVSLSPGKRPSKDLEGESHRPVMSIGLQQSHGLPRFKSCPQCNSAPTRGAIEIPFFDL